MAGMRYTLMLVIVAACAPSPAVTPPPAAPTSHEVATTSADEAPASGWYCFSDVTDGKISTTSCERSEGDCRSLAHDHMDAYADDPKVSITGCKAQDVAYCFHHIPADSDDNEPLDLCEATADSCSEQHAYQVKVADDPKLGSRSGSISDCVETR